MDRSRRRGGATAVALVLVVAACSTDDGVSIRGPASRSTTGTAVDATTTTSPPSRTEPCPLAPPDPATTVPDDDEILAGLEELGVASTVTPIDDSTSVVIAVDLSDRIRCTASGPRLTEGVVFAGGLHMDVLVPVGRGPFPLVVFVPGGGFATSDRTRSLDRRTYVAEAGFVVASIEYRTIGSGIYHDGVEDVKAAVRFLRARSDEYRIDPDRVAVWGESAGGYLAAMAGVTNGLAAFESGPDRDESSAVSAVVDAYGLSDLTRVAADFDAAARLRHLAVDAPEAQYLHGARSGLSVLELPGKAAAANPVSYVDRSDPPFLLLHGRIDPLVSPSQTLLLHTALLGTGVDSTRYAIEGAGHASDHFSTTPVMDLIVAFLARVLA